MSEAVELCKHAGVKISAGGKVVYIDPYQLDKAEKADIILITHEHEKHLSLKDIAKVVKPQTTVVIPTIAHPPFLQLDAEVNFLVVIGPGEKYVGDDWEVLSVPSYSEDHPKGDERIGFLLELGGRRYYHPGDSFLTEEMKNLGEVDVAFIPVGVMGLEQAVEAVKLLKPKQAIAIHCTPEEGKQFKNQLVH